MGRKPAFVERSGEATEIIQRAIDAGWSAVAIAEFVKVNKRQVYRWLHDGSAPHPIVMDGLRKLDSKVASSAAE
jgi:hypothetical protein